MSCLINAGLLKDSCQFLIGGISAVYLANKEEVVSILDTDTDMILDDITMISGATFYKFDTSKNTSNYTQTLTVAGSNKYILQSVDFFVPRADQDAIDIAEKLALGTFVAIVENRMGKQLVLGLTNGLEATVGEINSGVAEGDSSAVHFTLVGAELGFGSEFAGVIPV